MNQARDERRNRYRDSAWPDLLNLVGRVGMVFAGAATLGLVVLLNVLTDAHGLDYGSIIGSQIRSAEHLSAALWFFGLVLVVLSGLTTWLFAIYASFRIAGPMFRFARNIERAIRGGPVPPEPIRRDDRLQRESGELLSAIGALDAHYGALRQVLVRWDANADAATGEAARSRLRELDSRVRL